MVGATSQRPDHSLHLKLEKEGSKLTYGDIGLYRENVQLQVVGLL